MKHIPVLVSVLLFGCSQRTLESEYISPDPDIGIVETRELDQTDFIILDEPILAINEGKSPDLLFWGIVDVKILSSGRLVISDRRNHCLVYVSAEGKFIIRSGRRGAGPGELNLTTNARMSISKGDTVNIYDQRNSRMSRFDSDGTWINSSRLKTVLRDFAMLNDGTMLHAPHASQGVLILSHPNNAQSDTLLSREGFTGAGKYLANGWLMETLGRRIYLYHETSGLLLFSRSINSVFSALYLQDSGFRDMVKPMLNNDEPSAGFSLSIQSLVLINGFTADVDEDCVYIQLGDERLGDYRRIVKLDNTLRYLQGWKIPSSMVSRGLAARDGHLYTYSGTSVYQWF